MGLNFRNNFFSISCNEFIDTANMACRVTFTYTRDTVRLTDRLQVLKAFEGHIYA